MTSGTRWAVLQHPWERGAGRGFPRGATPSGSPLLSLSGRQTGSSQRAGAQAQGPHQGQLPQPAGLRPLPPRREGEFMERGGSPATHPPGIRAHGTEAGQGFPRHQREATSAGLSHGSLPAGPAEWHSWGQIVHPGPAPASGTAWFFGKAEGANPPRAAGSSRLGHRAALPVGDSGALLGGGGAVSTLVHNRDFLFRDAAVGDVLAGAGALGPSQAPSVGSRNEPSRCQQGAAPPQGSPVGSPVGSPEKTRVGLWFSQ